MKNIRVLDERNITLNIIDGVLEVYDQKGNLVGEAEMQVEIDETMSMDDVIEAATNANYDLMATISVILSEAVMTEQNYDIWLTDETMIMYSPSAGQYVAEPYEGVFLKFLEFYESSLENGDTSEETEVSDSPVHEADFEEIDSTEANLDEEGTNQAVEPAEVQVADQEVEQIQEQVVEQVVEQVEEKIEEEQANEKTFDIPENFVPKDEVVVAIEEDEVVKTPVEEVVQETTPVVETPKVQLMMPVIETEEDPRISDWKEAYKQSMISNTEQKGVKLSQLRDKVVEIVLTKGNALEIDESEVLFELLEKSEVVFEAKTALHAGLYQAYEFQKNFA